MENNYQTFVPDDLWEDDFTRFRLVEYMVYSTSPMSDPLRLSRSTVLAPSMEEALLYLIEAGRWDTQPVQHRLVVSCYSFVPKKISAQGKGMTKDEWINSVLLGYLPSPVQLVEGALVAQDNHQPISEPRCKRPVPKRRRRLMAGIERFFDRQSRYPKTWKAIGLVVAVAAALGALWMLWNLVISLVSLYLVARGVGAYLGSRW